MARTMRESALRDPMVRKENRVDTVYGLVDLMDAALAAAPRLSAPLLLMYGAHDEVVPRDPIAAFAAALPADPDHRRRLAYYRRGYHLLMRDLNGAAVSGGDPKLFDDAERATLALTREMTQKIDVSDGTMKRVRSLLPDPQVVELIGTIAGYNMVSRFVAATGVELEEPLPPEPGARR